MINIEKHTHSTHLWHIVKMLDFLSGDENMETTQVDTWELCETPYGEITKDTGVDPFSKLVVTSR